MRVSLRIKLLFFSIIIALVPLFVAGRNMIQTTQEELKSSANDELGRSAQGLAEQIDERYQDTWLRPLVLVRNAIDSELLGPAEKLSILQTGLQEITDVVALQLTAEGIAPAVVSKETITARLRDAGIEPTELLRVPPAEIPSLEGAQDAVVGDLIHVEQTGDWLLTVFLPLPNGLLGRKANLTARIDLARVQADIAGDPMSDKGNVMLVDSNGDRIVTGERVSVVDQPLVSKAIGMLNSDSRAASVEPFSSLQGEDMLGGYAFPRSLPWSVIVEMSANDAYLAVDQMRRSLLIWIIIGLAIASVGAIFVAFRISNPIEKISRVTQAVSRGDLHVRVEGVNMRDEIGDLAERVNEMIQGLLERFNLEKFVSGGTLAAVKGATQSGVRLGGERRKVTVFFSDIRGFTAFSERVEPEVVVEMLNTYLRHQAYIVKKYNGDIDKYVGDELVAVFTGDDASANAVRCSIEIQEKMRALTNEHPDWNIAVGIGINTGEVVMGAMGSEERMDFTILGDAVNLGARLCSAAGREKTLISHSTYDELAALSEFVFDPLEPIQVKGKAQPIQIYAVVGWAEHHAPVEVESGAAAV